MKYIAKFATALVLAFVLVMPVAQAAEFVGPHRTDNGTVIVGVNEIHKNLYVAGSTVFVNNSTQGDLFAAGGTITVDGAVEQDVTAAGGTLVLNGKVGGDARVAGGTITVNSEVGGDVLIGGGDVRISEKSKVGGDVTIGGGNVVIDAPVNGSIHIASGNVTINSEVKGSVTIKGGKQVVFGAKAQVPGKIKVTAINAPDVQAGAQVSTPEFTQRAGESHKSGLAAIFTLWFLIKIVAYALAGFLLIYFLPRRVHTLVKNMEEKMLGNFGIGIVTAIVVPVLALLVLFTFVGYYISLIAFAWYALIMMVSCLIAALFVGSWIVKMVSKKQELVLDWQAVVVGSVVFTLVGLVPFVGWLVQAIIALASVGAIIRLGRSALAQEKSV